ncbi:MAG: hypothetical protein ACI9EF_002310 [Pseudohongiellaceae bacterium]|jgi:hypothetical protein
MTIPLTILVACLSMASATPSAKDGFAQIQAIIQVDDAPELQTVMPSGAFLPWGDDQVDALRLLLVQDLRDAQVVSIQEAEGRAVVRFQRADEEFEREIPLRVAGDTWQVAAPRSYPVSGAELKKRQGRKPAKAKLVMRTENIPYSDCALSFVYATDDPDECANRMDLWYCHNSDLHGIGGNRIADLGEIKIKKVMGLAVAPDWGKTVQLKEKHSYLVHCQSHARSDFFVVLYVKKQKRDTADIEWTLLTGGLAAPPAISSPQSIASDSPVPSEPFAGLCGKNG